MKMTLKTLLGNVLLFVLLIPLSRGQVTVEWVEQNGVFIETGTPSIAHAAGSQSWGVSGAISMNRLAPADDGSLRFTTDRDGLEKAIGLSDSNVDDDYRTIDYGFRFSSQGATVVENGTDRYQHGNFAATDVFSVDKISGAIKYAVNGEVIYQSSVTPTGTLMADVAFREYNTDFDNIDVSFGGAKLQVQTVANSGISGTLNEGGSSTLSFETGNTFTWMPLSYPDPGMLATVRIDFTNESGSSDGYLTFQADHQGQIRSPQIHLFDGTETLVDDLAQNAFSIGSVGSGEDNFIDFLISWNDLVNNYWKYNVVCSEDQTVHWIEQRTFDEQGIMVGLSKQYRDDLGRVVQNQYVNFEADEVLAMETIMDDYGRTVLRSLPATINDDQLCYKREFVTNLAGDAYSHTDFDVANYTGSPSVISLGEVDNPEPVNQSLNGTLGWYYSNNNSLESHVPFSRFPYSRIEHDVNNLGAVKRTSSEGGVLRMGNGHEEYAFTMPAAGELYFVYGYGKGWNLRFDEFATSGEVELSSLQAIEYRVRKNIRVDPDGKEFIEFVTQDERVIATCSSGQVDGQNESDLYIKSEIRKDLGYTDIHIPEGCENSLILTPNNSYKILDLKTDRYLTFSGSTVFQATAGNNTPPIGAGYFRVIDDNFGNYVPGSEPTLSADYRLNYYDFTLHYYDKAKRLVKTVTPEGYDRDLTVSPQRSDQYNTNQIYTSVAGQHWSLDASVADNKFDISVPQAPNDYSEFTILSAFLTQTTTPIPNTGTINQGYQFMNPHDPEVPVATIGSHLRFSPNNELTVDRGTLQDPENPNPGFTPGTPPVGWQIKYVFKFDILSNHQQNGQQVKLGDNLMITAYYMGNNTWNYDYHHTNGFSQNVHKALVDLSLSEHNHTNTIKVHSIDEFIPALGGGQQTTNYTELHQLQFRFDAVTYNLAASNPDERLFTTNDFNSRGWLIGNTHPDEGATEYLYRKDGKPRFIQHAQQAQDNSFSYLNYDQYGRPVEQGVFYTPSAGSPDRISFVNAYYLGSLPNPADKTIQIIENIYDPANDLADGLNSLYCKEQIFTVYDIADQSAINAVAGFGGGGNPLYVQRNVRGRVSKTWTQNPSVNVTWYSYDERGRVEWTLQNIDGLGLKTVDYEYNNLGDLDRLVFQKNNPGELFIHRYTYDKDTRLIKVETSNDDATWLTHADYEYYVHGPLKRVELGGVEQTQGVDYTYAITGWLKAINHSGTRDVGTPDVPGHNESINYDPGQDGIAGSLHAGFAKDVFGMVIDYYDGDYRRDQTNIGASLVASTQRYNGKIRAVRWKNTVTGLLGLYDFVEEMSYGFEYDHQNRLESATFGQHYTSNVTVDANGIARSGGIYTASEDYQVHNMRYDANGNLLALQRNGYQDGGASITWDMDDFSYRYATDGSNKRIDNRLLHVDDALLNNGGNGYNDIRDQDPGNYQYNARGQLVHDVSKEEYYAYNDRGQLTGVYGNDQLGDTKAEFQYDERGHRLSKLIYDGSGNLLNTYWYVRDANGRVMSIYDEPAGSSAQVMENPVYGSDRVGVYYPAFDQYNYELNDQLGNVRAVVERATGGTTAVVARITDYYPYGHPMPGRQYATALTYRHGYQGEFTERDAILGLTAFEARHWDGRLGRWTNPDPARQYDSPYVGMGNNPITMIDPDGRAAFGLIAIKVIKFLKVAKPFIKAGAANLFANRASVLDDDGFGTNLLQGAGFFAVGAASAGAGQLGASTVLQGAISGTANALIDGKSPLEAFQLGVVAGGSVVISEYVTQDLLGSSFKKFGKKGNGAELLSKTVQGFTKGFTKEFSKGLLKGFIKGKFEEGELDKIFKKSLIAGGFAALPKIKKTELGSAIIKSDAFESVIFTVGPGAAIYGLHVLMAEYPSKEEILNFVKDALFVIDEKKK